MKPMSRHRNRCKHVDENTVPVEDQLKKMIQKVLIEHLELPQREIHVYKENLYFDLAIERILG